MGKSDTTKQHILDSALQAFLDKGLMGVSMEDLAQIAGCHRRTLYRYFPLREDLVYELMNLLLEDLNRKQEVLYRSLQGQGFKKMQSFLEGLAFYFEARPRQVRLMGEFDFFFKEGVDFSPREALSREFKEKIHSTEEIFDELIEEGLKDGSIKLSIPKELFIPTLSSSLWGMAQRAAIRGELIQEEYGLSGIQIVHGLMRIFINSLDTRIS